MTQPPRVLVIGGGSIGERHVRCFQRTGRATVELCEVTKPLRETVAGKYDLHAEYADLEAAMADPPEIAVIATPAHLHVPMAIQLAKAGVHLLIEKPLSIAHSDVDRLMALVGQRELSAAVAYVYRAHPALIEMREAICSGRFGKPVQLVGVSGQHFPLYRPAYREIYYADHVTGGGAVQDALTHLINAGMWLVGGVTELAADAAHQVLEGVSVEDTVHVIARHGDVLASYNLNQHQAANETTITVICESGMVRLDMPRNRWLSADQPGEELRVASTWDLQRDDLFVRQANRFLDVVQGRDTPACSLAEGADTLRVILAVLQAAETKTWQVMESG